MLRPHVFESSPCADHLVLNLLWLDEPTTFGSISSSQQLGPNYSSSKHFLLLSADNAPLITCLSLRMRAMRTCLFLFLLALFSYQGPRSGERPEDL